VNVSVAPSGSHAVRSDSGAARFFTAAALATLALYRAILSPLMTAVLGHACRFHPNCSVYAREAIAAHGLGRGGWLALRRLVRCRPRGGWGEDPVPGRDRIARV